MPIRNVAILSGMLSLFVASLGLASKEQDIAQLYDQKISESLKNSDCDQAGRFAKEAQTRNKNLRQLPAWFYKVIECDRGDWRDFGMLTIQFFDSQIEVFTSRKQCAKAEEYLRNIDKKYSELQSRTGLAQWSFRVAECYEASDSKKSASMYQSLVQNFKGEDVAKRAQGRINWLSGDRSWIYDDLQVVLNGVKGALQGKDADRLQRYASKSYFSFGFEEQLQFDVFDKEMKKFFSMTFQKNTVDVGSVDKRNDSLYLLKTEFKQEEYPFWFFRFERRDGGWQWTGIIISGRQPKSQKKPQ